MFIYLILQSYHIFLLSLNCKCRCFLPHHIHRFIYSDLTRFHKHHIKGGQARSLIYDFCVEFDTTTSVSDHVFLVKTFHCVNQLVHVSCKLQVFIPTCSTIVQAEWRIYASVTYTIVGPDNKIQLNFNENSYRFLQGKAFVHIAWKMAATLSLISLLYLWRNIFWLFWNVLLLSHISILIIKAFDALA